MPHPSPISVARGCAGPQIQPIELYNIEVEDLHTYYIGQSNKTSVWAHNGLEMGDGCGIPKPAREESGKIATAGRAGLSQDPKFQAGYDLGFWQRLTSDGQTC